MQFRKTVLAIGVAALTSGCATDMIDRTNERIDTTTEAVEAYNERAQRSHISPRERVAVKDGAWLPSSRVAIAENLGHEAGKRQISVNREFRRIQEVAERVTALTGIPVSISPEAIAPLSEEQEAEDSLTNLPPIPGGSPGQEFGGQFQNLGDRFDRSVKISYSGELSGFLDTASARFNVYWTWDDDGKRIRIFRMDTRTFRLSALPGNTRLTSSVSRDGSNWSGGGEGEQVGNHGGSSRQQTEVSFEDMSVWDGVKDSIERMLTSAGAVTATPSTGTITVTDNPHVLEKVSRFINDQNDSLGRQVNVNVRVLSVNLSEADSYGINWDLVYQNISNSYGMGFTSNFVGAEDASQLAFRVLESATGSRSAQWRESDAIIEALSKQGRVAQVTSASVTTLNNQPVPVQVGRQQAYLASSQTTLSDGQSSTALNPGTINTGFSMNLVPHLMDSQELLLQYAVDLSSLLGIDTVESGDSTIQTPEIETRNFLQRVRMNSGETLVVTGFEQDNMDSNRQGIGNVMNTMLGGGVRGSNDRSVLVILIQPQIARI